MAHLRLKGLSKIYPGGSQAVQHIDLEIPDGEFLVLVGPSGCGKSTTLRLIAGLEEASSGCIEIDGVDVSRQEPGRRDLAMVFQSYALYPHMTVRNNMAYGLKNQKLSKAIISERIEEAAHILQLSDLLDRKPAQLSGGQRQRVAMGRALVRKPKAFLLDEPLSNLDTKLRSHMRAEIKALHQRLRTTFVYVTHDQTEAMSLADRIVVMNNGRVEQIGSPTEIYDAPSSCFVAGFIGTPPMNIMEGKHFGLREKYFGFRPELAKLVTHGDFGFDATITLIEKLGAESLIHLQHHSGSTCIVKTPRHELIPDIGSITHVSIDHQHLLFFDQ